MLTILNDIHAWAIRSAGTKQWRMEDVGYFSERTGGSWDLRPLSTRKLEEILV